MTNNKRIALRAAVLIHEQLAGGAGQGPALQLPEYSWDTAARLQRQIAQANRRGWHRAAKCLREDLAHNLRRCQSELETIWRNIEAQSSRRKIPAAAEIYRDIRAIQEEFEEFEIELKQHELVVTTDLIALEDVPLGRFEIRLDWQQLGSPRSYRVVALDPNPAASNGRNQQPASDITREFPVFSDIS